MSGISDSTKDVLIGMEEAFWMSTNSVDHSKNISLYQQVRDILIENIMSQKWKPNTLISTEQELMEMYNVSRTTIRQAINMLVQDGLLEKRQGKGTIVKSRKLIGNLGQLKGFAEEVVERGLTPHSLLLRAEFSTLLHAEKTILQVPENEQVLVIERIRLANDIPIAVERSCWPERVGHLLMKNDLNTAKYYEILEHNNIYIKRAKENISAINATLPEADMLGIRGGEALLEMTRLSFGIDDRPLEYTRTKYRSDQYTYDIELTR
jgi:GntR family transcriptional regulator